ncbi:hypothetical protein TcCL_NonESM13332 [Trypanosoma cruzi]|nr:hypothetical protein TcCL_NonESM13332 [Trypanosoma cruzi]
MASLSEEIQRLSELFASGALSKEEFKAAKEVTIKSYTPLAATAPLLGEVGRSREEAEVHTPFPNVNISEFGEDAAGQPQREKAYTVLETILRNLLQFPGEEKYRRLRLSNPVLHSQLFSVPGAMGFLQSIGFARCASDDGDGDEWLRLPGMPCRPFLEEGLRAIHFLRTRSREVVARNQDFLRLRRTLSLEVRRERCEKAKAVGELRSYIVSEFCSDDAGDGLYSSQINLDKLETILTNVLRCPSEAKYRRLRLGNPAVYAAVLQQRGGMEVLAECAGGEMVEEAGEAFLLLREGTVTEGKLRCALQAVHAARLAVREVQEKTEQRVREEARAAVRSQARLEREMELRRHCPQHNSEGAELCEGIQRVGGRRVPVAEALRFLMGKGRAEEGGREEED